MPDVLFNSAGKRLYLTHEERLDFMATGRLAAQKGVISDFVQFVMVIFTLGRRRRRLVVAPSMYFQRHGPAGAIDAPDRHASNRTWSSARHGADCPAPWSSLPRLPARGSHACDVTSVEWPIVVLLPTEVALRRSDRPFDQRIFLRWPTGVPTKYLRRGPSRLARLAQTRRSAVAGLAKH